MTTSRERVRQSLNFMAPDRLPKDLGGMLSSSISAFSYPKLVAALGLPARRPLVYDTGQMLAMPDRDVLDALGIDIVTICGGVTNAFDQPDVWHDYDFNGRLAGRVRNPAAFRTEPDGTIVQGGSRMPPSSVVFDEPHGGQALDLQADLPKYDLKEYKKRLEAREIHDDKIVALRELCRRVHDSTDRAVFFNEGALVPDICIHGHGGIAVFPLLCLTEPDYVAEMHEIIVEQNLKNVRALLPEVAPYIDVMWLGSDDWGTQKSTMASPKIFRNLFLPYRKRINDECHRIAPDVKTFLHSCGAIYDLLDMIIESGFDILNPVQWTAGGHSYREWKDKARGRLTLWGGGVDAQNTLPLGTVADVTRQVQEVAGYLAGDGGFIFCNIHNLLAEIPPEKIIAMYRTADTVCYS
jgi:uroporphyrinogen decarboxylase